MTGSDVHDGRRGYGHRRSWEPPSRPASWLQAHPLSRETQWRLLGVAGVTAFALGYVGMHAYQLATDGPAGLFDITYRVLQLFVLESGALMDGDAIPVTLEVARFLAPAVGAAALLRVLATLFRDQLQLLRMRLLRGHVIVCGLGRKGLGLARSLRAERVAVVVIELDAGNDHIDSCRATGATVLVGDATDRATLHRAGIAWASRVVSVCGDSGTNAEVAAAVHDVTSNRRDPIDCLVHVDEPRLFDLLRTRYMASSGEPRFRLDIFNVFERGAQVLLLRHPFDGDGTSASHGTPPHVLVVGLGRLGQRLVVEAARTWRSRVPPPPHQLRMTVVDQGATANLALLELRHPEIRGACDIAPVDLRVETPEFEDARYLSDDLQVPAPTIAYVCFDDDVLALRTGLVVHDVLAGAPVVVRSRAERGVPALLRTIPRTSEFDRLHAFALLDHACDADFVLGGFNELLARALHAQYVGHREAQGWSFGTTLDADRRMDPSLAPWHELSESLRASNRAQAAHTGAKLEAVGCTLVDLRDWEAEPFSFTNDEVEHLAALEHQRWVEERAAAGWRRGPRDPGRRRSPYLVDYDELPDDIKEFDRMFVRNLPHILARLGYQIARTPDGGTSRRPADPAPRSAVRTPKRSGG